MFFSPLGSLETYGLLQVISQGYEKLVLDPKRYGHVHGQDTTSVFPHSPVPQTGEKGGKTIILVTHSFYPDSGGGTERFGKNLAVALQKAGNHVIILAYSARVRSAYPNQCVGMVYAEETIDEIPVIRFRRLKPNGAILKDIPQEDPALEGFARELFSRIHPDMVHFLHLSRVSALAGICFDLGIPYFVTVTDFFALCHSSTRIDRTGGICDGCKEGSHCAKACPTIQIRAPEKRYQNALCLLKGAERVVAPSEYVANVFQREFPELMPAVIPHGIGPAFSHRVRDEAVRRFLFIGRLSEVKGACGLIRAFRNMPEDCVLRVCGNGSVAYKNKLKRLAAKDGRITFHDAVPPEKVGEIYDWADCVVVPSLVPETYNFVVREALQSGCLVVASATGAIPEAVTEGRNGFMTFPGDEKKLLEGLWKAYRFSWNDYLKGKFPSARDEVASYMYLYEQVKGE